MTPVLGTKTITMVIKHLSKSWDDSPSIDIPIADSLTLPETNQINGFGSDENFLLGAV